MQADFPEDTQSEKAREGTAAHFYVTEAVQGRIHPVGTITPNGHPIDAEMVENGEHFIRSVDAAIRSSDSKSLIRVETKVTAHNLIHPNNEGTPDWFLVDPVTRIVKNKDYKYGHLPHDPYQHWQLINYTACIIEGAQLTRDDIAAWRFDMEIIQPRNYAAEPVREWSISGNQLWPYIERLRGAAYAAKQPNAPLVTGPHCRDCRARHACPVFRSANYNAMDMAGEGTPEWLDETAIGLELTAIDRAMKRLEARRTGLSEVAIAKIQSGKPIRGWMMGRGDTREAWNIPAAEVFVLGDMRMLDLRAPAKPLTPNQARKAGLDEAVTKQFASKPAGALKLMPADAKAAAKAFGK